MTASEALAKIDALISGDAILTLVPAEGGAREGWQPIETCPAADYKSYYLFNPLWEDGWSVVQRANCFEGTWIFDSGLKLDDCETKFNPVMWHPDTTPRPPISRPPLASPSEGQS